MYWNRVFSVSYTCILLLIFVPCKIHMLHKCTCITFIVNLPLSKHFFFNNVCLVSFTLRLNLIKQVYQGKHFGFKIIKLWVWGYYNFRWYDWSVLSGNHIFLPITYLRVVSVTSSKFNTILTNLSGNIIYNCTFILTRLWVLEVINILSLILKSLSRI